MNFRSGLLPWLRREMVFVNFINEYNIKQATYLRSLATKAMPSMMAQLAASVPAEYAQTAAELDALTMVQPFTSFMVVTTQLTPTQLATLALGNVAAPKLVRMAVDYDLPMSFTTSITRGDLATFSSIVAQVKADEATWPWKSMGTNLPITSADDKLLATVATERLKSILPVVNRLQRILVDVPEHVRVFATYQTPTDDSEGCA